MKRYAHRRGEVITILLVVIIIVVILALVGGSKKSPPVPDPQPAPVPRVSVTQLEQLDSALDSFRKKREEVVKMDDGEVKRKLLEEYDQKIADLAVRIERLKKR